MSNPEQTQRSPASRVRVNGGTIKFIRESKGLTQLYVASFLGVTTDTISRWENGRYPTVKWDNVERLAKALEVEAEELLNSEAADAVASHSPGEPAAGASANSAGFDRRWLLVMALAVIVLLVGAIFIVKTRPEIARITATRFLPRHITPGQPFPVVVRVESSGTQPFTFILEEQLPANFSVVRGLPEVASLDPGGKKVKWINNSRQSPFFLAYLVQTPVDLQPAGEITFTGRIKADNAPGFEQNVLGDSGLTISNYHWVDGNSDGIIDDAEILTAFSSAEMLTALGVDLDLIKKIWSAGGYDWDREKRSYRIIQKKEMGG